MGDQRTLGVAYPADQIVGLAEREEQLLAGAAGSGAGGFALLGLDVRGGDRVVLRADGPGAEEALDRIARVVTATPPADR